MTDWQWRIVSDADKSNRSLFYAIDSVFQDGFERSKAWGEKGIRKRLVNSNVIGLLYAADGHLDGYALYSSSRKPFDGGLVLWENALCVRRRLQGTGRIFRPWEPLCKADELWGRKHAWLGGVTQNPAVFRRYSRLGCVFPVERSYRTEPGVRLIEFLLTRVPQMRERAKELTKRSGRIERAYGGRLGKYRTGIRGAENFEAYLSKHHVQRDAGDALVIVAQVR
jgi:hypothetical protein